MTVSMIIEIATIVSRWQFFLLTAGNCAVCAELYDLIRLLKAGSFLLNQSLVYSDSHTNDSYEPFFFVIPVLITFMDSF